MFRLPTGHKPAVASCLRCVSATVLQDTDLSLLIFLCLPHPALSETPLLQYSNGYCAGFSPASSGSLLPTRGPKAPASSKCMPDLAAAFLEQIPFRGRFKTQFPSAPGFPGQRDASPCGSPIHNRQPPQAPVPDPAPSERSPVPPVFLSENKALPYAE